MTEPMLLDTDSRHKLLLQTTHHSIVCVCEGCYVSNTGEFLFRAVGCDYERFLARIRQVTARVVAPA